MASVGEFTSVAPRGRGRGRGRPARGRGGFVQSQSATAASVPSPEREEESQQVQQLRKQYRPQLSMLKPLFSTWSDEDLLFALSDATGDVETTVGRISEGLVQQWGAVKPKKTKKEAPAVETAPASGAFFNGRGGFADRGGRGGRGGFESAGRGGRGGRGGAFAPRGGRGGLTSAPRTNGEQNGSASAPTPDSYTASTLVAPTWGAAPVATPTWGDEPAAPVASSEWGAATETSTTATVGWGDEQPASTEAEPVADGWGDAPVAAPKARVPSKVIAPGSKMSWAQVTRPVTPPKPAPAPVAPVVVAPSPPVAIPEPIVPAVVEHQIILPELNALPEPTSASWAAETTAPGPLDAWGASTPAPLGVGAGWADAVGASQDNFSQVSAEVVAHLPPNDINAAGPIEVSAPVVEDVAATSIQDDSAKFGTGPPGLTQHAATRPQQAAVVMPNERAPGVERVGVQFGSLNMFDGQPSFGQEAAPEAPVAQDQAYNQQYQSHDQQQSQEQGVQTSFGQQNLFQQGSNSAFADRYASSSPYQQPQIQQQQQQQPSDSAYAPFKNEAPSPYFQPQHSQSPAGQIPQASYAPFNSAPQQAPAQPDYSAYAQSQDSLRNMGFYDPYQNSAAAPRSDDPTKTNAPATSASQQQQQQQQQQQPGQYGQGMMPYYPPYGGYYQGYPQGYQQQNYSQYPQGYGMPQQYPGGRSLQGQYPQQYQPQPPQQPQQHQPQQQQQQQQQSSIGSFRQAQPTTQQAPGQGQYGQQPQYGYGQYDQQRPTGQAPEQRKEGNFASSKDLDRAFF